MEQRLSVITLGVADLAVAKNFYENVVGWKPRADSDEIIFFDLGGLVFALYPITGLGKEINVSVLNNPAANAQRMTMAHNARSREDVDQIFDQLRSRGATILKEPVEVFWGGYSGYFADPDGHLWEVAHNPFWQVGEDGRITMSSE